MNMYCMMDVNVYINIDRQIDMFGTYQYNNKTYMYMYIYNYIYSVNIYVDCMYVSMYIVQMYVICIIYILYYLYVGTYRDIA